jgi:hypothetical protein
MLSNAWMAPSLDGDCLVYPRARRDGISDVRVPLKAAPERDQQPVIAKIAELEGRPEKKVCQDMHRLTTAVRPGPYDDLREGEIDPEFNRPVETLIMQARSFVVYLDDRHDVMWNTSEDYGDFPPDFGKVINRVSVLLAEPTDHLNRSVVKSYRSLVGEGVARLLDDRTSENALAVLDMAERYLRDRSNETARRDYVIAGLVPTLFSVGVAVALWQFRTTLDARFVPGFTNAAVAACMGAVGAFTSIFYRVTKVDLDARAGTFLLMMEGSLRILVGVVAATLVGWAINANFLLGFMSFPSLIGTKMLFGALAGASESVVPTLMTKFDTITQTKSAPEPAKTPEKKAATAAAGETPTPPKTAT